MKRYDSYKDSGVQWIGEIPSHWTSIPIKFSTDGKQSSFIDGDWIESNVIESEGIRYLTTGNVGAGFYKEQGSGFISEKTFDELNCTEVYPGDLLISRLNEPIGRTCIVPDLGYRIVVSVDNVIYRPNKQLYDERYLMFQMNCKPYADNANFIARGSTMSRISRTTLGQIKVLVPPLKEQKAIAEWLDVKCGEIDRLIATQQRRIELLQELRQSIITRAVTRGINPDAHLRDSGIDWIGQIPSHWSIKKLKYSCKMFGRIGFRGYSQADLVAEGEGAITLSPSNMNSFTVDYSKCSYLTWDKYYESPEIMVKIGDVLLVKTASVGKCSYVDYLPCECTVNPQILVLKEHKDNPVFLAYLLNTPIGQTYIQLYKVGSTIPTLSEDKIGKFTFAFPPLSEQREIVAYIEQETTKVDHALQQAERQIELLQELRQSVITEVVTGKRKVC